MAINAKAIQVFVLRIVKLCVKFCYRFVLNYPIVSFTWLFLFVLYFFLPKVFILLICSSLVLAGLVVYTRFYLPSKRPKTQNDSRDETGSRGLASAMSQTQATDRIVKSSNAPVKSQIVSQRSVRRKNIESDSQTQKEDNTVSSGIPGADSAAGETVAPGEKPRGPPNKHEGVSQNESSGENMGPSNEVSECSAVSSDGLEEQAAKRESGSGEAGAESSSSEEEGGAKQVTSKAMEWTEEDQKNLMDLGISELERNKRLESLVVRRRARKLYKMNTERTLNHNNAFQLPAAVSVSRDNRFGHANDSDEHIPGSAPSFLPSRNPFDLPYDPLEEKPNLMADSFQQEFAAAYQKEMFFCRHERFTWAPYSRIESKQIAPGIAGRSTYHREKDKEDNDWQVDQLPNQEEKTLRRSLSITDLVTEEGEPSNQVENQSEEGKEADTKTDITDKQTENTNGSDSSFHKENSIEARKRSESSLSSLSDDNEQTTVPKRPAHLRKIEPPAFRFPDITNSPSSNYDPCPIPKARSVTDTSYLASPATIDRASLDNHLLYTNNGLWHTPSNSIASDMQVEVSETGSPPLRGDGSDSSSVGESLTYDGDIEKEITSGSDEILGFSLHASTKEHEEVTSTDVKEFNGEVNTRGFSAGFYKEPDAPIPSSSGPTGIPEDGKSDGIIPDSKFSVDEEKQEGHSQKPQEISYPSEKTTEKSEFRNGVIVPDHTNDSEGSKSVENRQVEAGSSFTPEKVGDRSIPDVEFNTVSSVQVESKPSQSVEAVDMAHGTNSNPVAHANVTNEDMKSSENRVDGVDKNIEQKVIEHLSERADEKISESGNNPESNTDKPPNNSSFLPPTKDSGHKQSGTEFEVSGMNINQSSNNLPTSGIQPEMAVEQASTISYTSSENRVDGFDKKIEREVLHESPTRDEENISESGENPERNADKPTANPSFLQPIRDSGQDQRGIEFEVSGINQGSNNLSTSEVKREKAVERYSTISTTWSEKMIDEIGKNIDREVSDDSSTRAEENISQSGKNPESSSDKPIANSSFSQPTPDSGQDQSGREFEVSGINKGSNNLSTSGMRSEMAVERSPTISTTSSEDTVDGIGKNIEQKVFGDSSKRAAENISESGKNPERDADRPPASLSFLQLTRDSGQEQTGGEFEVSGKNMNQRSNNTSGIQPEMAVEQASTVSTTSFPMSVLPDRIPLAETSSHLNAQKQLDDSGYDTKEKRERDKSLDEKLPDNLVLTSNHNAQHITADNMPQESKETSKSADNIVEITNLNEPVPAEGGTKGDMKSLSTMDGGSEPSISHEASIKLSEPQEKINSKSVEQVNDTPGNLTEYEARNGQSKPEKGDQDSKLSGLALTEKESRNPSQEFKQYADGNSGAPTNPVVKGEAKEQILPQDLPATKDEASNVKTSKDGEHGTKQLDKKQEGSNVIEDPISGPLKVMETGSRNLTDDIQLQAPEESNSSDGLRNINDVAGQGDKDSTKAVEDISTHSRDQIQDTT